MKKFAFINIPSQELERPPAAAAAISACVKSAGWDCKVFDFNLFLNTNVPAEVWVELEEYWRCKKLDLAPETKKLLDQTIDQFLVEVKKYSPNMIGLSVFTRFSVLPAAILLDQIKKQIDAKIVIGGSGSFAWPGSLPALDTKTLEAATFAEYAKQVGLIDYFIQGEGETAIVALLNGLDTAPGINGAPPEQVKNLDSLPHPDYTGIEPSKYFYTYEPGIYITATRGCIRKCTFCNIPEMWPKFEARSAEDVVREIVHGKKKYNVNVFHFTDSLLNGNMKIWREINRQLIEAKKNDTDLAPVKYLGQFICRTRLDQTERDWNLMSEAGADLLVVGFEHFSPHVRKHMGKHYSNADIDFHFAQSGRLGIKNVALMFVGYPVETLEDHEYNIEFLHRYQRYAKAGIIHMVRWGYTGMFRDATKVEKPGEVKLITDPDFSKRFNNLPQGIRDIALGFGWVNELNPTLTLRERIRRRLELHEISVKLGWPQTRNREELQILHNILENLSSNIVDAGDFDKLETLLDFH